VPLLSSIKDEFNRAPIATLAAPSGVFVGLAGMVLAWLTATPTKTTNASDIHEAIQPAGTSSHTPSESTALIVVCVFLALTPSFASIVRILYRLNCFVAVPLSLIAATLNIFLNRLNANILGYEGLSAAQNAALDNLNFYGTVVIFLSVAGRHPLSDFVRATPASDQGEVSSDDAAGTFLAFAILILIWCALLGWSQKQMTMAFLT